MTRGRFALGKKPMLRKCKCTSCGERTFTRAARIESSFAGSGVPDEFQRDVQILRAHPFRFFRRGLYIEAAQIIDQLGVVVADGIGNLQRDEQAHGQAFLTADLGPPVPLLAPL